MAHETPEQEAEPAGEYDRFGERKATRRRPAASVDDRPAPDSAKAEGSASATVIRDERAGVRTFLSVLWLLIVVPLLVAAGIAAWYTFRGSSHDLALTRLRMLGAKVDEQPVDEDWTKGSELALDLARPDHASRLTDADLTSLRSLNRLVELDLSRCNQITAEGLKELGGLKDLRELKLGDYQTPGREPTRADFEPLTRLSRLRSLDLGMSERLNDRQLAVIARMTRLKELRLGDSSVYKPRVTDSGVKELGALVGLTELSLGGTAISDASLANLRNLTRLEVLDLEGTQITDAGLEPLKGLSRLAVIHLEGTQVTRAGVANLQSALPLAEIYTDFLPDSTAPAPGGQAR